MINTKKELIQILVPLKNNKKNSLIKNCVSISGNEITIPYKFKDLDHVKSICNTKAIKFAFKEILKKHSIEENLLREYSEYLDWKFMSESYPMSEEFIENFEDQVCWVSVYLYQTTSDEFRTKHGHRTNIIVEEEPELKLDPMFGDIRLGGNIGGYVQPIGQQIIGHQPHDHSIGNIVRGNTISINDTYVTNSLSGIICNDSYADTSASVSISDGYSEKIEDLISRVDEIEKQPEKKLEETIESKQDFFSRLFSKKEED